MPRTDKSIVRNGHAHRMSDQDVRYLSKKHGMGTILVMPKKSERCKAAAK